MSLAQERRSLRRLAVDYEGELAVGAEVFKIAIADVSFGGCGVEVSEALDAHVGQAGVLIVRGVRTHSPMLPVIVANQRQEDGSSRLGLKFRDLSKAQFGDLVDVLEQAIGADVPEA